MRKLLNVNIRCHKTSEVRIADRTLYYSTALPSWVAPKATILFSHFAGFPNDPRIGGERADGTETFPRIRIHKRGACNLSMRKTEVLQEEVVPVYGRNRHRIEIGRAAWLVRTGRRRLVGFDISLGGSYRYYVGRKYNRTWLVQ